MLQYWENAGVVSSPEASAAVLTAVREHSDSIPPPHTVILGAVVISSPEVASALRTAKPGRSPVVDGIPNELYSQFPDILIPFFSCLFSIIGSTHSFPPSFSAGVITTIYKRGPLALPSSYRPITLLNTDYRLLARIIAAYLSRALSTIIHPSQTSFLRGPSHRGQYFYTTTSPRCTALYVSRWFSFRVYGCLSRFCKSLLYSFKTFLEIYHDTDGCGSRFPRLDRPLLSTIPNQSYGKCFPFPNRVFSGGDAARMPPVPYFVLV
jgi:hypothetical protein